MTSSNLISLVCEIRKFAMAILRRNQWLLCDKNIEIGMISVEQLTLKTLKKMQKDRKFLLLRANVFRKSSAEREGGGEGQNYLQLVIEGSYHDHVYQ